MTNTGVKLRRDHHSHGWLGLHQHATGKRVVVRIQSISAIVEGNGDDGGYAAAIYIGESPPVRVSDAFDDVVGVFMPDIEPKR